MMDERSQAFLTLALDLPESARADIAAKLLESLEPGFDAGVEAAWKKEVAKRMAEIDAGEVETVPWEQVRNELFDRLSHRRAD